MKKILHKRPFLLLIYKWMNLLSVSVLCTLLSCGSTQSTTAQKSTSDVSTSLAVCETDPKVFTLRVFKTIHSDDLQGVRDAYVMDKEELRRFLIHYDKKGFEQHEGEDMLRMIYEMQRSDLAYEVADATECPGTAAVTNVRRATKIKGFTVHLGVACKNGEKGNLKVEQILFEGCLRLGNVEFNFEEAPSLTNHAPD